MANRQYIGARYVPKFFDGENGSSEWVNGVSYEPLTIVTYLGNSFTSKKPVPSSIGSPNNNPEYWANTGNYNAQVQKLQEDVENTENGLSILASRVTKIEPKVERLTNRKFIFVGDSFMNGYVKTGEYITGFAQLACNYLNLNPLNYTVSAHDGAGFMYANNSFIGHLKNVADTITNHDEITDIYTIGGTNDVGQNPSTQIAEYISYAKQTFPNAIIHIGYDTFPLTWAQNGTLVRTTREIYRTATLTNGGDFIDSFCWCLDETCRTDKTQHPSEKGQQYLAECLVSSIVGNGYHTNRTSTPKYLPITQTSYSNLAIYEAINDDQASFTMNSPWTVVIPDNAIAGNSGDVIIGALSVDTAIVQDMPPFQIMGNIHYKNSSTEYIPFKFQLQNGNVTIAVEDIMKSYTDIDFVVFNAFTTSFSRSIG